MALPKFEDLFPKGDGLTYEQYSKLYLNNWTLPAPPPPANRLPEWILPAFRPYEEQVRTASRIEVSQDAATFSTIITAYCLDGQTVAARFHEGFFASVNLDTSFLTDPPLPAISSPHPILGWRQWKIGQTPSLSKVGMFGLFGQHWETPEMRARCAKGHDAPAEDCRCGIYFTKDTNRMLWGGPHVIGLVVATDVIEHEYGYRAGLVRCIAITNIHPEAYGWDGISILNPTQQHEYASSLRDNPSLIPYPNDLPAP